MLKKISRIGIAAALGVATLAFHVDDGSAQTPRPRKDKVYEFGQGRNLPYYVSRSGHENASHPYYHLGWWYDVPWWMDSAAYNRSTPGSTAAFRVYGSTAYDGTGPIADPYPKRHYRYYRNGTWYDSPVGFLAAPITLPLTVATAPFRALSGEPVFGSRHVSWCSAHYRSYNPATNTWVSYRRVVHRCVSPY